LSGCDFFAEVEVRRAEGEGGVIPIKICRPKVTEMQDPPSHGDRSAGIRRFSVGSKNAFEKMNTTLLGGQVIANVDLPWETPLPAKLSGGAAIHDLVNCIGVVGVVKRLSCAVLFVRIGRGHSNSF